VCWICLDTARPGQPLQRPCACPRYVHMACISRWCLQSAGSRCAPPSSHVSAPGGAAATGALEPTQPAQSAAAGPATCLQAVHGQ
jgi:hypothetical protein